MWHPAEHFGSPERWRWETHHLIDGRIVEVNGPYPSRGDYEFLHVFETPHVGECESVRPDSEGFCADCGGLAYVALTPTICDLAVQLVERSRGISAASRRLSKFEREERKDKDWDGYADDVIRDAQPILYGQPFVTVPRNYGDKEVS